MMHKCKFTDCTNCSTVVWDCDSGLGCMCMGWAHGKSVLTNQLCCEPKTSLKNRVYFLKSEMKKNKMSGITIKYIP